MKKFGILFCLGLLAGNCNASDAGDALAGAMRWYYRWMADFPPGSNSVQCRVAEFEKSQFAYCEPGKLAIDIDTPQGVPASVLNITTASSQFPAALTDFLNHRYPGPPQIPSVRMDSIPKGALGECREDLGKTRQLVEMAADLKQKGGASTDGLTLRFPLACEGDPFYLAFFMKADVVQWIWQIRPGVGPVWSYDRDNEQRKIPDLAIRNLAKPEMWYTPR